MVGAGGQGTGKGNQRKACVPKMARLVLSPSAMNTATATKSSKLSYTILETKYASSAMDTALFFSACLGADRGYTSEIKRIDPKTVDVVASDGRAIRFTERKPRPNLRLVK